jgi:hypothetical protein
VNCRKNRDYYGLFRFTHDAKSAASRRDQPRDRFPERQSLGKSTRRRRQID